MVELKTAAEIDAMREAGRVVATILDTLRAEATVGTRLQDLDEAAREVLDKAGAYSPFLNYHPDFAPSPYPAAICTSVNEAVVHAIPDGYRLRDGDLLTVDCGAVLDGWAGDAAVSFCVGTGQPADLKMISDVEEALRRAIAAAVPGNRLGDIAAAIAGVARPAGYGIPEGFGGHGIGRQMHEAPHVPNDGRPGRGLPLRAGLVLAIEPMFMAGGRDRFRIAPDGWAVHTIDGSRAAHVEHSVAITEDGPRVLTVL